MQHAITPYWTRNHGSDIAELNAKLRRGWELEKQKRAEALVAEKLEADAGAAQCRRNQNVTGKERE